VIKKFLFKFWPLFAFIFLVLVFFYPFWLEGKLPIPADTIVGMYHPWRDQVWDGFTTGVPFKNFLITDPVRQQIPWRQLVISAFKKGQLPRWNPYSLAGTPLLANFQSASFYFFNFLFAFLSFPSAWSILIMLQPLLAGIFIYLYLQELKLSRLACLWGAIVFAFCGFAVAWLEWGTLFQAALWLPLILLTIEKIISSKKRLIWSLLFVFSLSQSFLAGHLQIFFYVLGFSFIYLLWRLFSLGIARQRLAILFFLLYLFFIIVTLPQWRPTLALIVLSARGEDQAGWQQPGWFLPWQHLVQFLAPDFFGNPTTLNYWGVWNYGEMVGFIGIIPLLFVFGLIRKKLSQEVIFFFVLGLIALSFALPTPWSKLIFASHLPLLSTSQPTRLLFLVDFCLAVLTAFGLDLFLKEKKLNRSWLTLPVIFIFIWLLVLLVPKVWPNVDWVSNLSISRRNLILPTAVLGVALILIPFVRLKSKVLSWMAIAGLFLLTGFDLLRFGWKFTPFTPSNWLFPSTKVIEFLQADKEIFRIMSVDDRIMPPNFASAYELQEIGGYDPLYLQHYGELIAAMERNRPNINSPFGFNRIITPKNYSSPLVNLLNVKYVLSLTDLQADNLELVFQEGETHIYQNQTVLPRAFLVYDYRLVNNKQEAVNFLFSLDLSKTVILEKDPGLALTNLATAGSVKINNYQPQEIELEVKTDEPGILVLTDSFYPGWRAFIDGQPTKILAADYHFRAIMVPTGKSKVVFEY
jgi:hypothetical protein